jgi:DNA (cytosine-5)-methyltransferase 1
MRRPSLISLFTGCGGLDYGLEEAGFDVRICVENEPDCRDTIASSRPKWRLADPGDITAIEPLAVLRQAGLRKRRVDLVAGGPPCQPFSKAGFWHRGSSKRMDDPRADALVRYFAVVEAALPRAVLLENVAGIAYRDMDEGWQHCVTAFAEINERRGTKYDPVLVHVNAADYGVPQIRHRVFVIAERSGKRFELPAPTHTAAPPPGDDRAPYLTAWDAIGDADLDHEELRLTGKWAGLVPSIPEGQNYLWHTRRGGGKTLFGWRTRFWSFLLKLSKTLPSWTIQATPGPATGPFHWRNRLLSIGELQRLQTIPADVKIAGEYRSAHRQVGNAVPSAVGEMLGLEIRRQFYGTRVRRYLKLVPKKRRGKPQSHPTGPVPRRYLDLVMHHADHPGEGLGPGTAHRRERTGGGNEAPELPLSASRS